MKAFNKTYDIIGKRKVYFIISIAILVVTIAASLILGVKMDIEFTGGSMATYSYTGEIDLDTAESVVEEALGMDVDIQQSQDIASGKDNIVVSVTKAVSLTTEELSAMNTSLEQAFPSNEIKQEQINNVDPVIGQEFLMKSLLAVAVAMVLMIVYIAFRFRKIGGWSAGVMAVIALLHDAVVIYAVFVICGIPLNNNFIAAVLTILGYSINATIVVYDRVRENKRLMGKVTVAELVNTSVNQSLTRSINTTVATILALLAACIMALIFNVDSILTFAFPLIVGMVSGVYSSLCISSSLWVVWQEHKAKKHSYVGKSKKK
ncbi:MAG: protein translocase subunit SecF [Oscillospiraceae bacterium]